MLCCLATAFGIWAFGRRAGFYVGLCMSTCVGLFLFTRILIPDVMLALTIVATGLLLGASGITTAAAQQKASADTAWTYAKPLTGRALPCENGKIKIFDCQNVELLSYLPKGVIGGTGVFDIWGWNDSTTGREFVIVSGSDSSWRTSSRTPSSSRRPADT